MIKALIFDIGGVTVLPGGTKELRKEYSKVLNINFQKFNYVWYKNRIPLRDGKINIKKFWDNVLMDLNKDYDIKKLNKIMYKHGKANKDILNFIKFNKKKYKIAALTNNIKEWFSSHKKRFKLNKYFDVIITSFDTGLAKPNKKIYFLILKKLKLKPNECLFIDDYHKNINTAKKLGMKTILYRNFKQFKTDFNKIIKNG